MKLTPLADNVLLKHMEAEEKTASGIILSTANKEKSVIAEVISAGPGTDDVKVTVKPGDKVKKGDVVAIVEAMKMENAVTTDYAGTVKQVLVQPGENVATDAVLVEIG